MTTSTTLSRNGFSEALGRLWQPIVFGTVVIVVVVGFFETRAPGQFGTDFKGTLFDATHAFRAGRSPYPHSNTAAVASGNPALYPPFTIALVVPLTYLGWHAASWIWAGVLLGGALGGLWLFGVRDWRCYCVFLASLPVLLELLFGNLTMLLLLGLGAAWRWRDRAPACGAAVGALFAAKLFLWPMVVWLLLTRRYRAAAWSVAFGAAMILVPWALIGFNGLADYPALLRSATDIYGPRSSSLMAAAVGAGIPLEPARAAPLIGACLLLAVAVVASRKPNMDRRVFAVCVLAGIAASPIVWNHNLVLLAAPVAVLRPRLSWLWLALPAAYVVDRLHGKLYLRGRPAPEIIYGSWSTEHYQPALGPALMVALILVLLAVAALLVPIRSRDDA